MTASMNTRTWLRDASITGRLRTTVVITIVALTLVAIAYAISQGLSLSAVRSTTAGVTTYQDLADVQRLMLQARRNEKDFLARKDLAYVRQHKDTMAATFAALARARNAVTDSEQLRQIEQVRAAAAIYQAEFGKATDTLVKVGLDENSGLHGEMRLAAHDVERVTEAANLLPLTVSLLQMRRHEKDFLQRVDSPTSRQTYRAAQQSEYANFRREVESTRADLRPELRTQGQRYYDAFVAIADGYETIGSAVQSLRDAAHTTEPALDALKISADGRVRQQLDRQRQIALDAAIGLLAVLVLAAIAIIRTVTGVRAQVTPAVQLLTDTIGRISAGDAKARTKAETAHELGDIGRQMDKMMDEREAINERIARENEQLNNSVIGLLSGAARMSQRDLTVKLPVAEDVTGAVADAINSMAEETAKVLGRVVDVADQVAMSAQAVKSEARTVIGVATTEREAIDGAATQLEAASATMLQIAQLALKCNDAARKAIGTTEQAQGTVLSTVAGIASIRETIRETEKRIKRLGERSQEISGVVNLINSIAERTHILALNASMHAASAGEAGRGFAVVANEVQRLAENARDATSKIGALVNNIQVETADTVVTINDAITKVVSGSDLAERAGAEMRTTRDTTAELVELVQRIAADSEAQASLTTSLRTVAGAIQSSTKQTYEQLQSQLGHTELLVEFSDNLVSSVSVFTLPQTAQVARAAATPAAAPERAAAPRLAPARA